MPGRLYDDCVKLLGGESDRDIYGDLPLALHRTATGAVELIYRTGARDYLLAMANVDGSFRLSRYDPEPDGYMPAMRKAFETVAEIHRDDGGAWVVEYDELRPQRITDGLTILPHDQLLPWDRLDSVKRTVFDVLRHADLTPSLERSLEWCAAELDAVRGMCWRRGWR